jgi:low temperature requirement protein LtrA
MTEQQVEAKMVLLLYCFFAFFAVVVLSWIYFTVDDRRRKEAQFKRRDHIMDQAALRVREVTLFIEHLWQTNNQK